MVYNKNIQKVELVQNIVKMHSKNGGEGKDMWEQTYVWFHKSDAKTACFLFC